MKALVKASGRQFILEPGRHIDIDLISGDEGSKHVFDKVIMLVDGNETTIGQPYVQGAAVVGRIMSTYRAKKVIVYHMRPKKGTRKKQGHRQEYTRVMIDQIEVNDKVVAKADPVEKPAKKEKAAKAEKPKKAEAPKKAAKTQKEAKPAAKSAAKGEKKAKSEKSK